MQQLNAKPTRGLMVKGGKFDVTCAKVRAWEAGVHHQWRRKDGHRRNRAT
jgi:hypothetical protein